MKHLIFLIALPALAQFSGLTTTPDGSKLYFASPLRQRNTTQPLHGKIFSLDDREMKPVLIIESVNTSDQWSNYHNIQAIHLDENGNLAGYTASRACFSIFYQICYYDPASTRYKDASFPGNLTFSPNRRFALGIYTSGLFKTDATFYDLGTGRSVKLSIDPYVKSNWTLTNDGTLWRNTSGVVDQILPRANSFEVIPLGLGIRLGALVQIPNSANLLAWSGSATGSQLLSIDTSSKSIQPIGPPVSSPCNSIAIAARGTLVATCQNRDTTELLRLDPSQSHWRTIDSAIREWTLSADGSTIWYLSSHNAFHKVNLLTETNEMRLPPIGLIETPNVTSPGSLLFLYGTNLENSRLRIYVPYSSPQILMPVAGSPTQRVYLMPSDLPMPLSSSPLEIENPAPSLFEFNQRLNTSILPHAPRFFDTSRGASAPRPADIAINPLAVRENFSTLINRDNPARPGEIVHLYAVNLSATNAPGFQCIGNDPTDPPGLLFAGPAPGITGLYQVTLRLPSGPPSPSDFGPVYNVFCGYNSDYQTSALLPALEGAKP